MASDFFSEHQGEFSSSIYDFLKTKFHEQLNAFYNGEAVILQYIIRNGGECAPGDIKEHMAVSSARVATALGSLEKKGMISREIDRADRRRILVTITEEGNAFAQKQRRAIEDTVAQLFEYLGEDDTKEFLRIISRIAEYHQARHAQEAPPQE